MKPATDPGISTAIAAIFIEYSPGGGKLVALQFSGFCKVGGARSEVCYQATREIIDGRTATACNASSSCSHRIPPAPARLTGAPATSCPFHSVAAARASRLHPVLGRDVAPPMRVCCHTGARRRARRCVARPPPSESCAPRRDLNRAVRASQLALRGSVPTHEENQHENESQSVLW